MVSTVLYICWKKLPSRMGKKKGNTAQKKVPNTAECDIINLWINR